MLKLVAIEMFELAKYMLVCFYMFLFYYIFFRFADDFWEHLQAEYLKSFFEVFSHKLLFKALDSTPPTEINW